MASFASSATTCGARKHAWTKKKEVKTMASFASSATTCATRKHAWTNIIASIRLVALLGVDPGASH